MPGLTPSDPNGTCASPRYAPSLVRQFWGVYSDYDLIFLSKRPTDPSDRLPFRFRHPAQHQLIQTIGEGGGILGQFAVEDLRLLQQQKRQVCRGVLVAGDRRDQGMA